MLKFRNIAATPQDPVSDWGFEGMLAAIDRGYAQHWRKMVDAALLDEEVASTLEESLAAAESTSTVRLIRLMLADARRTPAERALERLRDEFVSTGLSQAAAAALLGTSRSRLNSYLSGKVTPSMVLLEGMGELARRAREPHLVAELVLH